MRRPQVLVLDVNETLTDLEPVRAALEEHGLPGHVLETFFAETLRDGFALCAAGSFAPFGDLAADSLRGLCSTYDVPDPDTAVAQVLGWFAELPAHRDVAAGLRRIHAAGIRLVTLTNGATAMSDRMLADEGLLDIVQPRLSVETPQKWKPHPGAYLFAAEQCGVAPDQMALAAVHPWDVDGAQRAGLLGCWVDRRGTPYPTSFQAPDVCAADFGELADLLTEAGP